eukprot:scaffold81642_cov51-Attheya_sp.AAC.1
MVHPVNQTCIYTKAITGRYTTADCSSSNIPLDTSCMVRQTFLGWTRWHFPAQDMQRPSQDASLRKSEYKLIIFSGQLP